MKIATETGMTVNTNKQTITGINNILKYNIYIYYININLTFGQNGIYIYIYSIYIYTVYTLIKNSAVKRLITINHIQNKSFCLHNIKAHTYSIYFENIYMYLHVYIYIHIIYIIYKYIQYINFLFLYLYIHNKYTQYTHIYFYIQLLFWM